MMGIFTDSYPGDREGQKDERTAELEEGNAKLKDEVADEWVRAEQALARNDELEALLAAVTRSWDCAEDALKHTESELANVNQDFDDLGERCGAAEAALEEMTLKNDVATSTIGMFQAELAAYIIVNEKEYTKHRAVMIKLEALRANRTEILDSAWNTANERAIKAEEELDKLKNTRAPIDGVWQTIGEWEGGELWP